MRRWLYHILVEKKPGIHREFLSWRTQNRGFWKTALHLLKRNLQWSFLGKRDFLCAPPVLPVLSSESVLSWRESPQAFAERLEKFDAVSFDVFDTLIFRPFSHPADLFYLVGQQLRYPDFRRLRMEAERTAREEKQEKNGSGEVTLEEIWEVMERETGIPKEKGMTAEWEWEQRCCFANPYMAEVVGQLREKGKRIFALSDMYLGEKGYGGCWKAVGMENGIFVSCQEIRVFLNKTGDCIVWQKSGFPPLFSLPMWEIIRCQTEKRQRENGFVPFLYPNIQETGNVYRTQDISPVLGSVYRGLVNAALHCGKPVYSKEYEYGFVYGRTVRFGLLPVYPRLPLEQNPVEQTAVLFQRRVPFAEALLLFISGRAA